MTTPPDRPIPLDPAVLSRVLSAAYRQVSAALWLSAGMVFAFALIVFTAFSQRLWALA